MDAHHADFLHSGPRPPTRRNTRGGQGTLGRSAVSGQRCSHLIGVGLEKCAAPKRDLVIDDAVEPWFVEQAEMPNRVTAQLSAWRVFGRIDGGLGGAMRRRRRRTPEAGMRFAGAGAQVAV